MYGFFHNTHFLCKWLWERRRCQPWCCHQILAFMLHCKHLLGSINSNLHNAPGGTMEWRAGLWNDSVFSCLHRWYKTTYLNPLSQKFPPRNLSNVSPVPERQNRMLTARIQWDEQLGQYLLCPVKHNSRGNCCHFPWASRIQYNNTFIFSQCLKNK